MTSATFGMHVRFTAQPGQGDALSAVLLEAAEALGVVEACRLYVVSRAPGDPDTIWVTEAWTDAEAHAASLQDEATKAAIARAMPLMAGRPAVARRRQGPLARRDVEAAREGA
jgi:quinol monooxygenase YgiN